MPQDSAHVPQGLPEVEEGFLLFLTDNPLVYVRIRRHPVLRKLTHLLDIDPEE